ncbi:MAG: c-type cytochrome [Caldimonas sp.]
MNILSRRRRALAGLAALVFVVTARAAGDAARGATLAQVCMACHSWTPGRHLTGPSLADVVGRKAGTAAGFGRYSDALRRSEVTWDKEHLDAWLKNPAALVPDNAMAFEGIAKEADRADLIAYLEAISSGKAKPPDRGLPALKDANAASRVTALSHCGDGYKVTTADGKTRLFWEFNLRFKTDGSADGPAAGHPVIVGNGMRGDRASVIFSRLVEIPRFVQEKCT